MATAISVAVDFVIQTIIALALVERGRWSIRYRSLAAVQIISTTYFRLTSVAIGVKGLRLRELLVRSVVALERLIVERGSNES